MFSSPCRDDNIKIFIMGPCFFDVVALWDLPWTPLFTVVERALRATQADFAAYVDSGASRHMTGDRRLLDDVREILKVRL